MFPTSTEDSVARSCLGVLIYLAYVDDCHRPSISIVDSEILTCAAVVAASMRKLCQHNLMSPSPFVTVPPGLLPPIYPWSELTHPDTEIEVPAPGTNHQVGCHQLHWTHYVTGYAKIKSDPQTEWISLALTDPHRHNCWALN